MAKDPTQVPVDDATRESERRDAAATTDAGREPTPDEERIADQKGSAAPGVAEHEREMNEIGANVKGEGAVE